MNATVPVESGQNKNHTLRLVVGCVVCLLVGLVIGHMITYHWAMEQRHAAAFTTPYQAVLLSNGAVYYGKLSGYGSRYPTLTDIFYIVSKTDPEHQAGGQRSGETGQGIARAGSHVSQCQPDYFCGTGRSGF